MNSEETKKDFSMNDNETKVWAAVYAAAWTYYQKRAAGSAENEFLAARAATEAVKKYKSITGFGPS